MTDFISIAIYVLIILALLYFLNKGKKNQDNEFRINRNTLVWFDQEDYKKIVVSSTDRGRVMIIKEYPYVDEDEKEYNIVCATELIEKLLEQ